MYTAGIVATTDNVRLAEYFCKKGFKINEKNKNGHTPIEECKF